MTPPHRFTWQILETPPTRTTKVITHIIIILSSSPETLRDQQQQERHVQQSTGLYPFSAAQSPASDDTQTPGSTTAYSNQAGVHPHEYDHHLLYTRTASHTHEKVPHAGAYQVHDKDRKSVV